MQVFLTRLTCINHPVGSKCRYITCVSAIWGSSQCKVTKVGTSYSWNFSFIKIFLFLILTNSDFFLSNIQEFFKYIIKAYLERSKTVPFIIVKGVFYLNFWFGYIIILLPLPHLGGFVFLLAVYPGSSSGESRSWQFWHQRLHIFREVIFNFFQSLMTLGKCRKRRRRRWSVVLTTKRPEEERVLLKGTHSNLAVRRTLAITASQRWWGGNSSHLASGLTV